MFPMGYRANPHKTRFYNLPCQFASKHRVLPPGYREIYCLPNSKTKKIHRYNNSPPCLTVMVEWPEGQIPFLTSLFHSQLFQITQEVRYLLLMIINSWTRTASAAYASKIMTLTTAHSLPQDTLVYRVLGSFSTLDRVCVEPGCVPSSEYASKN